MGSKSPTVDASLFLYRPRIAVRTIQTAVHICTIAFFTIIRIGELFARENRAKWPTAVFGFSRRTKHKMADETRSNGGHADYDKS